MIPSKAVQTALYEALKEGLYPIHEVVPSNDDMLPVITIGELRRTTNFTKTNTDRFTYSVIIHGWSKSNSSGESKEIEEFIYQTAMNLSIDNYEVELVTLEMNNNLREDETRDSIVFHSVQQFEITISKKGE